MDEEKNTDLQYFSFSTVRNVNDVVSKFQKSKVLIFNINNKGILKHEKSKTDKILKLH